MTTELPLEALPPELRRVADDEVLLRSVQDDPSMFQYQGETLVVFPAAFRDRYYEPSVDRRILLADAAVVAKSVTDGLLELVAAEVRALDDVQRSSPEVRYEIDPVPRPLTDNRAHAVISHRPEIDSDRTFKRLRKALARLAEHRGWALPPASVRGP